MATEYIDFEGTASWCFLRKTDKFGHYSLNFYPKDDETRKALKSAGLRNGIKEDKDGKFYYKLRRKADKGMPRLINADGTEYKGLVGNGSKVLVLMEIYDYDNEEFGAGKGGRIEAVKVLDLVKYEPMQGKEQPHQEGQYDAPADKRVPW